MLKFSGSPRLIEVIVRKTVEARGGRGGLCPLSDLWFSLGSVGGRKGVFTMGRDGQKPTLGRDAGRAGTRPSAASPTAALAWRESVPERRGGSAPGLPRGLCAGVGPVLKTTRGAPLRRRWETELGGRHPCWPLPGGPPSSTGEGARGERSTRAVTDPGGADPRTSLNHPFDSSDGWINQVAALERKRESTGGCASGRSGSSAPWEGGVGSPPGAPEREAAPGARASKPGRWQTRAFFARLLRTVGSTGETSFPAGGRAYRVRQGEAAGSPGAWDPRTGRSRFPHSAPRVCGRAASGGSWGVSVSLGLSGGKGGGWRAKCPPGEEQTRGPGTTRA
ncbi:hypothetical protein SKAU_G00131630 [Synaphobranchus kaupii]|uniref:Uncharacterized protein n=1 Tax=Synaphobranchus kaupii TaxID=118154 RepID=A0A9Q1FRH8_SYNKA|nr:hypothetical protein SKAU_G00131630 [Synaphobranchus kaupii]